MQINYNCIQKDALCADMNMWAQLIVLPAQVPLKVLICNSMLVFHTLGICLLFFPQVIIKWYKKINKHLYSMTFST